MGAKRDIASCGQRCSNLKWHCRQLVTVEFEEEEEEVVEVVVEPSGRPLKVCGLSSVVGGGAVLEPKGSVSTLLSKSPPPLLLPLFSASTEVMVAMVLTSAMNSSFWRFLAFVGLKFSVGMGEEVVVEVVVTLLLPLLPPSCGEVIVVMVAEVVVVIVVSKAIELFVVVVVSDDNLAVVVGTAVVVVGATVVVVMVVVVAVVLDPPLFGLFVLLRLFRAFNSGVLETGSRS